MYGLSIRMIVFRLKADIMIAPLKWLLLAKSGQAKAPLNIGDRGDGAVTQVINFKYLCEFSNA